MLPNSDTSQLNRPTPMPAGRRLEHLDYNATLTESRKIHDGLRILRVACQDGPLIHVPGEYTILGLSDSSPYVDAHGRVQHSAPSDQVRNIQRAYSFSSRILDDAGKLVDPRVENPAEFYVALVPATADHPPGLTPRLFALNPGDRLLVGQRAKGTYKTCDVKADDDVVFGATGTGEAPHNGMIADLLRKGHRGRIVSVVCVRYFRDLAYLGVHRELELRYPNYRYVALTTREPCNLDPSAAGFVGKQYLQAFLVSSAMQQALGRSLTPGGLHIYLCGSPEMIGAPQLAADRTPIWPASRGALEVLVERGFRIAEHGRPGDVHIEKYW